MAGNVPPAAPTRVGPEGVALSRSAPEVERRNLASFSDRLAQVPAANRVAWSVAARDVSGALAAWAQVDTANAGVLRDPSTVIARATQDRRRSAGPAQRGRDSGMAAALVLMATRGDKPQVAAAALMAQLLRAAAAIADYHREVQNLREAVAVDAQVRQLRGLTFTGYGAEPVDSHRVAPLPGRPSKQTRNAQAGPTATLPKPIDPQPYRGATVTPEKGRDDGGR